LQVRVRSLENIGTYEIYFYLHNFQQISKFRETIYLFDSLEKHKDSDSSNDHSLKRKNIILFYFFQKAIV